jgi:hypothetical protein
MIVKSKDLTLIRDPNTVRMPVGCTTNLEDWQFGFGERLCLDKLRL